MKANFSSGEVFTNRDSQEIIRGPRKNKEKSKIPTLETVADLKKVFEKIITLSPEDQEKIISACTGEIVEDQPDSGFFTLSIHNFNSHPSDIRDLLEELDLKFERVHINKKADKTLLTAFKIFTRK